MEVRGEEKNIFNPLKVQYFHKPRKPKIIKKPFSKIFRPKRIMKEE